MRRGELPSRKQDARPSSVEKTIKGNVCPYAHLESTTGIEPKKPFVESEIFDLKNRVKVETRRR